MITISKSRWDHNHEAGEINCPQPHCCGGQDNFHRPETEVPKIKPQKYHVNVGSKIHWLLWSSFPHVVRPIHLTSSTMSTQLNSTQPNSTHVVREVVLQVQLLSGQVIKKKSFPISFCWVAIYIFRHREQFQKSIRSPNFFLRDGPICRG